MLLKMKAASVVMRGTTEATPQPIMEWRVP